MITFRPGSFTTEVVLACAVVLSATCWGLAQMRYTAAPQSELVIHGSSTVNDYSCQAGQIDAYGRVNPASVQPTSSSSVPDDRVDVHVRIPVRSFDCGKKPMNRDMYEALQGDEHPTIQFELVEAHRVSNSDTTASGYDIVVQGKLAIAGTTRPVSVEAHGRFLSENRVRLTGRLPLQMTAFGVTPPTALFGLIKARNEIEVAFDLVAQPAPSTPVSSAE